MKPSLSVTYLRDGSTQTLGASLSDTSGEVVFLADPQLEPSIGATSLARMEETLKSWGAGLVYSDSSGGRSTDYQLGSIRDDFDFGGLVAVSKRAADEAYARYGAGEFRWGALYDLRLKLSIDRPIVRIPESLYATVGEDQRATGERIFDYVDPARSGYQLEMEGIATDHLKRIGAYLEVPGRVAGEEVEFPRTASVVIPVRNREGTIRDAVESALAQQTDFSFNVIVVENHSTDSTHRILEGIPDPRLVCIVPERTDLGIGGCWNEAVLSDHCGRYAVQLDSDDLFADAGVVERLVREIREHRYAMLVGAYTTVDQDLNPIPPGLVAHLEWTPENGHNNALRVNGFGAPRVYDVSIARQFSFPNVSYGEDYAVGLRICRDYEIGRIFDSVYLCRRWEGNTDSDLGREALNAFNAYKDWVRSGEIRGRMAKNQRSRESS